MSARRVPRGLQGAGRPGSAALVVLALLVAAFGVAQDEAIPPATARSPQAWLTETEEARAEARETPGTPTPDRAAWERALTLARRAVTAAEGTEYEREALRALASTYGEVRWWSRAWEAYERLADTGSLTEADAEARLEAARQLAFARYQAGVLEEALRLFEVQLEARPNDPTALRWMGRILLESGRPEEASTYWQRLLEVAPDAPDARYYLELAQERATFGRATSDAYREGLAAHEAGDLEAALQSFERALELAPDFEEAQRWRARVLLESGRNEAAQAAWQAIAEANPEDEDAAYFADQAAVQARFGREAAVAARDARRAWDEGRAEAALEAWRRATEAAPDWTEAWAGLGRAAMATGEADTALAAWRELEALAEEGGALHEEALRGQAVVEDVAALEADAALSYVRAVQDFEAGNVEAATEGFERTTELAPEFPPAWGWLGRIAFSAADYATAAEHYARASELAPGDDDYAYFAEQAERLATSEDGR